MVFKRPGWGCSQVAGTGFSSTLGKRNQDKQNKRSEAWNRLSKYLIKHGGGSTQLVICLLSLILVCGGLKKKRPHHRSYVRGKKGEAGKEQKGKWKAQETKKKPTSFSSRRLPGA